MKNERFGHEVHLKKRPTGSVKVEDFELVTVEIPDLKEEGDFLVRNVWMSIDPFLRIYMVKGTKFAPPFELHKPLDAGCIGEVIESKSRSNLRTIKIFSWFTWNHWHDRIHRPF